MVIFHSCLYVFQMVKNSIGTGHCCSGSSIPAHSSALKTQDGTLAPSLVKSAKPWGDTLHMNSNLKMLNRNYVVEHDATTNVFLTIGYPTIRWFTVHSWNMSSSGHIVEYNQECRLRVRVWKCKENTAILLSIIILSSAWEWANEQTIHCLSSFYPLAGRELGAKGIYTPNTLFNVKTRSQFVLSAFLNKPIL